KQALEELEQLQELAEAALRKALAGKPSAQTRQEVNQLLGKIESEKLSPLPEKLRALRSIEVLEHIDSEEARALLQKLAQGAPEARLTIGARASEERLRNRLPDKP